LLTKFKDSCVLKILFTTFLSDNITPFGVPVVTDACIIVAKFVGYNVAFNAVICNSKLVSF
jgi:hypothetical protein